MNEKISWIEMTQLLKKLEEKYQETGAPWKLHIERGHLRDDPEGKHIRVWTGYAYGDLTTLTAKVIEKRAHHVRGDRTE